MWQMTRGRREVGGVEVTGHLCMNEPRHSSAEPHERVEYRIAAAESSGLPDGSADLVTAAQSLHWFDVTGFFAEARRVAKPDGIVAVWTYTRPGTGDPAIDAPLEQFHENVIAPWWPPERRLVDTGYRTVPFPFAEIDPPQFEMTARWTLRELLGYIGTWSATARLRAATGGDPIPALEAALDRAWGGSDARREVRWRLSARVGRCT